MRGNTACQHMEHSSRAAAVVPHACLLQPPWDACPCSCTLPRSRLLNVLPWRKPVVVQEHPV